MRQKHAEAAMQSCSLCLVTEWHVIWKGLAVELRKQSSESSELW